jgi:nicotinamide phosphoribosyltransferase
MITGINPMLLIDGYKTDHRRQYPEGTEYVYSNFTPRQSRIEGVDGVVVFGMQYFIKEYLIDRWNECFFSVPREKAVGEYVRMMDNYLGKGSIACGHIYDLHDLGYLPIKIKAIEEGEICPIGVPVFTIINTDKRFFWLVNYLETLMSNVLWKPMTSATTALRYRREFEKHADKTGYSKDFVQWQGHDFSYRGMSGSEDSLLSSAAHLLCFTGTDTIPAISFLERYYNADSREGIIGGSVPATEHSVMCMGEEENEIDTFRRLINKLYPSGIVSIVSDTWDFWKVMTEYLPELKEEILARDGRVVIRPDSGDPIKIICGDEESDIEHLRKGAYQVLWEIFGGHVDGAWKHLNGKIGMIYGDSITTERQKEILSRLEAKGFSASNLVLGIGSFTYEYVTRDTFGFAMKATWGMVNGKPKNIFKNPKTDSGFKKSAKGMMVVYYDNGKIKMKDQVDELAECTGILKTVFYNGALYNETSLSKIRNIINEQIKLTEVAL